VKIYVQWATLTAVDWIEIDSSQWGSLAKKLEPTGGETLDENPGWLHQLDIQAVKFSAHDHYWMIDNPDGSVTLKAWSNDPADYAPNEFWGVEWTFHPLAPDLAFGGATNTKQIQKVYAASKAATRFRESLPWEDFVIPPEAETLHGVWFDESKLAEFDAVLTKHSWRDWGEGGKVPGQRELGLWDKPKGTRTVYQRQASTTITAFTAGSDHTLDLTAGTSDQVVSQSLPSGGAWQVSMGFASVASFPGNAQWHDQNGSWREQLDVSAAGGDVTYSMDTFDHSDAGIYRLNAALSSSVKHFGTSPGGGYTGTGLKMFTTGLGSTDFQAAASDARFAFCIVAKNAAAHGAGQDYTLDMDNSDSFHDGPYNEFREAAASVSIPLTKDGANSQVDKPATADVSSAITVDGAPLEAVRQATADVSSVITVDGADAEVVTGGAVHEATASVSSPLTIDQAAAGLDLEATADVSTPVSVDQATGHLEFEQSADVGIIASVDGAAAGLDLGASSSVSVPVTEISDAALLLGGSAIVSVPITIDQATASFILSTSSNVSVAFSISAAAAKTHAATAGVSFVFSSDQATPSIVRGAAADETIAFTIQATATRIQELNATVSSVFAIQATPALELSGDAAVSVLFSISADAAGIFTGSASENIALTIDKALGITSKSPVAGNILKAKPSLGYP